MEMLYCALSGATYYKPTCRVNEKKQGEKFSKPLFFTPQFFGKATHIEGYITS